MANAAPPKSVGGSSALARLAASARTTTSTRPLCRTRRLVRLARLLPLALATLLVLAGCARPAAVPLAPVANPSPTPPPPVTFPRDAGPHDTLTEWWYYTGHLRPADDPAREYGFEFVIFQVQREGAPTGYMAHFAVTDVQGRTFSHQARSAAGAFQPRLNLDVGGWRLWSEGGGEQIEAAMAAGPGAERPFTLRVSLRDEKPPALHNGGFIQYGPAGGSYYYSRTRLAASGELGTPEGPVAVAGQAWMDHQWGNFVATSSGGGGWDWYSLQLADRRDLMLYVLRAPTGETSAVYGSLVQADGTVVDLPPDAVRIQVLDRWQSPHSGAVYPSGWLIELPAERLSVRLLPELRDQELYFPGADFRPPVYWEGAVSVLDETTRAPLGEGYVELTGYAAP